eukprot:351879-Chlamydomonas_euryale.AAC.2
MCVWPRPRACTHVNAQRPEACPWLRAGLGLGRRNRPEPAAWTHVLCTGHPASASHKGEREDKPLMHVLHACRHAVNGQQHAHACMHDGGRSMCLQA